MIRIILLLAIVVLLGGVGFIMKPKNHPPSIGTSKYVVTLTPSAQQKLVTLISTDSEAKRQFNDLRKQADVALNDKPNPSSELQSSGMLKGEDTKSDTLASAKDANKVYALSMAYAVTGNPNYANKAKEIILAWAKTNNPSSDPINERLLTPMFMGYDLIRPTLTSSEQNNVSTWLTDTANTLIDNVNSSGPSGMNNHNSHLLNIVGTIGYITGDQSLISYATDGYKKQIDQDLNADGSSFDFHQRDALYYHVFTLEPLLSLARIASLNGTDLYSYQSPSGASLAKSIAFLIPYVNSTKSHAEWVNSTVDFDKQRAAAGEKGFAPGTLFKPEQAYTTLLLSSYFDQSMLPSALKISPIKAKRYPDFMAVYLDTFH